MRPQHGRSPMTETIKGQKVKDKCYFGKRHVKLEEYNSETNESYSQTSLTENVEGIVLEITQKMNNFLFYINIL